MKKSELRSLIRESIKKILKEKLLTETFKSSKLTNIYKLLDGKDKEFFDRMYNTYNIDWANVPDALVKKGAGKGINLFIATQEKDNPWAKDSWYQKVTPGLIGVTLDKKPLYATTNRWTNRSGKRLSSSKGTGWDSKNLFGKNQHELNNFKRYNTLADLAFHIDIEELKKYDPSDVQNIRKERKMGAISFIDDKAFASANKDRYQKILRNKVGDRTTVDDMMKEVIAISNNLMTKAFDNLKMGKYGGIIAGKDPKGFEKTIRDVAETVSRATDTFSRYIEGETANQRYIKKYTDLLQGAKDEKKRKEYQGELDYYKSNYSTERVKEYALELKGYLNQLKSIQP